MQPGIHQGEVSLRKEINLVHSISIVVGSIIGSGIFVSPSIVLLHSGSFGLSLVLWAFGGIISIAGGLCYCELGTFIPSSGAEYSYVREAFSFKHKKQYTTYVGSLLSFLVVWTSVIVTKAASLTIITLTFSQYLLVPLFVHCQNTPTAPVKLITIATLVVIAIIGSYNVTLTARIQVVLSALKVLACVFIIAVGIWQAIAKDCLSQDLRHPWVGTASSPGNIVLALYAVLWAYDGWNTLNYSSEEQTNLSKNFPRAIIIGILIVIVCYLLVNASFFVVLSRRDIINTEAVALPWGSQVLGTAGLVVMPILIAVSTFGAANLMLYAAARQSFAAARTGHLPKVFSGIHRKYRTPIAAVIFQTVLSIIMCAIGDIGSLIDSFNAAIWLFYGMTFVSLLILRITHKEEPRPYKVWLPVPIFMVCVSVLLVVIPLYQSPVQSVVAFIMVLCGIPVHVFLVMETPRRLRPKILDTISEFINTHTSQLLNTVPST